MRRQRGFSYLIAMFAVAIGSIVAARAMESTMTREQRMKEAELLYVGQAYRSAIREYYENTPGTVKHYPPGLTELLQDPRLTQLRRPLRKLYRDPITGGTEWGLVLAESGGIKGVFSLSTHAPYKSDGFPTELAAFAHAARYRDWHFVYEPH